MHSRRQAWRLAGSAWRRRAAVGTAQPRAWARRALASAGQLHKHGAAPAQRFACADCGAEYAKWARQCAACKGWSVEPTQRHTSWAGPASEPLQALGDSGGAAAPGTGETAVDHDFRLPLSDPELSRVFGGGVVLGSISLLAGAPGSGKSTLALQLAHMLAESPSASGSTPARVLYLSAEESPRQVRDRAKRLGVASSRIDVLSDPEVASCAELVEKAGYRALVVDSIQTVHLASVPGEAGGVVQVRACALRLLQLAKQANVAVVLVGHVTKDNQLAGPRTLEHLVDVVLTLEGETLGEARWLSGTKNRFGPNETGAFRMTAAGFQPLGANTDLFVTSAQPDRKELPPGVAWTIGTQSSRGSRFVVAEIQSLVSHAGYPQAPARIKTSGVPLERAALMAAVLAKHVPQLARLQTRDVFLNCVGGVELNDAGSDLGLAVSLASGFLQASAIWPRSAAGRGVAFVGEVGLAGEIRPAREMSARVSAAEQLDLDSLVVSRHWLQGLGASGAKPTRLKLVGCADVKELVDVFVPSSPSTGVGGRAKAAARGR